MQPNAKPYPEPAPERRLRALSRPGYRDRRTSQRFLADFPVDIFIGEGEGAQVYRGRVVDISNGGLRIHAPDVPSDHPHLRMRFRIPEGAMPEEFIHGAIGTEGQIRRVDKDTGTVGVEFVEPLAVRLRRRLWGGLRVLAVLVLIAAVTATIAIKYVNLYSFWFDVPVFLYSIAVGGYLLTRFIFASFYREARPLPEDKLPTVAVIVPVRNEEEHIERTVQQVMESDYPADKLKLVVVNDGSTDGTMDALRRARARYPEIVVLGFPESQGKRRAMAAGFEVTRSEVVVFVDSDSFLAPDALRRLVIRFRDPEIASVTGHCEVENQWTNFLTKMQSVRYFTAFRVMKAAESIFDSVTCLSGPLAAYRRDILEEILPGWLNQRFMGQPATFGDDRSLTNMLLRRGFKVVYESGAKTTTIVPESHHEFLRQQIRWKRSWFRESLIASAFMWRRQPLMALSFYLGFLLPLMAPVIVLRALVYLPLAHQSSPLMYIGGVMLMSALLSSTYLLIKRSRLWIYGVAFCFYYMFVLVWQLPWAVLTFTRTEWSTRS